MFESMTKARAYAYLTGIFFASMIVSNILATRTPLSMTFSQRYTVIN